MGPCTCSLSGRLRSEHTTKVMRYIQIVHILSVSYPGYPQQKLVISFTCCLDTRLTNHWTQVVMCVSVFSIGRFEYNSLFGGKINKPVVYTEYVNMRPFLSEPQVPSPPLSA